MTAHKPHIQVLNQQAELFELMASVEFISIPFVIAQIAKECEETAEADFLLNAKRIQHAIKCLWAALKKSIDLTSLMLNTLLFDLKGYDCEFAFVPPPSLQGHHLSEALKAIHHNPETLSKYDYIGFKREELETILGFSLLTTEQQAKRRN